jgi:monoamine oxidase
MSSSYCFENNPHNGKSENGTNWITQRKKVEKQMKRREVLSLLSAGTAGMFLPWHGAQAGGAKLRGYLRTNWSRDPYAFGSYSYVAKGAEQHDRSILAAPIANRVYFAGEAIPSNSQQYRPCSL